MYGCRVIDSSSPAEAGLSDVVCCSWSLHSQSLAAQSRLSSAHSTERRSSSTSSCFLNRLH